jgi:hypothetical protein
MPEQSSMHFYLNWAKERIDEMDAERRSCEGGLPSTATESTDHRSFELKQRVLVDGSHTLLE